MVNPSLDSPSKRPLVILSTNIEGLCPSRGKPKVSFLREKAHEENISILALTESHLHKDYHEGELEIKDFTLFRSDRTAGIRKGGVVIYLRNHLSTGASICSLGSIGNIEFLAVNIRSLEIIFVCVYRPPVAETANFIHVLNLLKHDIESCVGTVTLPNIVFTGDLNLPNVSWGDRTISSGTSQSRTQATALFEFFDRFFIEQYVTKPTRNESVLDLFATNDSDLVSHLWREN